jgi:23S rRNA (guanosine2251-2'-O)-methyltransferase
MVRRAHKGDRRPKLANARSRRRGPGDPASPNTIYGLHAVEAALGNPNRVINRLFATENAARRLSPAIEARGIAPELLETRALDDLIGGEARHQGIAVETEPLAQPDLVDLTDSGLVVVLDQVTDPQNVGAVLRSSAAFGASAIVTTERRSPPITGVLAKAASGALEHVAIVKVPNLASGLRELGQMGFFRIGLEASSDDNLEDQVFSGPTALVFGAEGKGLRRLTGENCDMLCRLRTAGKLASLNVSNAAAIALHTVLINRSPG